MFFFLFSKIKKKSKHMALGKQKPRVKHRDGWDTYGRGTNFDFMS